MQSKVTSVREIDAFTEQTIRDVDLYLRQQDRERWDAEVRDCRECDEHFEELEEEYARYWHEHCPVHGCELQDGACALCTREDER